MTTMEILLQQFGFNAIKGYKLGLTVQQVANINKTTAIDFFGLNEDQSELIVTLWVEQCKLSGIMSGK